jgi:prevent-host-death family protein
MDSIPLAEAHAHLSELIVRVQAGDTIDVTPRGKPVARLTASPGNPSFWPRSSQSRRLCQHMSNVLPAKKCSCAIVKVRSCYVDARSP